MITFLFEALEIASIKIINFHHFWVMQWRNLSKKEKLRFENMAAHIAATRPPKMREEKKSKDKNNDAANKEGGNAEQVGIQVYECNWDGCDFMFEEMDDLVNHVIEGSGHLRAASKYIGVNITIEY